MFLKPKILGVAFATFVGLIFTACDEVKGIFASIEEPLVTIELDKRFNPVLVIQSQDNETVINAVKLNRGNCGVVIYETSKESLLAYARAYRDRVFFKENALFGFYATITFLENGKPITLNGMGDLEFGSNGLNLSGNAKIPLYTDGLALYNSLDEASKSALISVYPVKLPYGEKFYPRPDCSADKIIEVELETNGGTFTYNFEQGGVR